MNVTEKNLTENVKFVHLRYMTYVEESNGDDDWFVPVIDNMGGITVAYTRNSDGTVNYALAICSDKDNYNKRLGRQISSGRLAAGNCVTRSYEEFVYFLDHWKDFE